MQPLEVSGNAYHHLYICLAVLQLHMHGHAFFGAGTGYLDAVLQVL